MEDEAEFMRQANVLALAQSDKSWSYLRSIKGEATQLYMLGLSCRIHEFTTASVVEADRLRYLRLLEDFTPKMVKLPFYRGLFTLPTLEAFLRPTIERLKFSCTHLALRFPTTDAEFEMPEFFVRIMVPSAI